MALTSSLNFNADIFIAVSAPFNGILETVNNLDCLDCPYDSSTVENNSANNAIDNKIIFFIFLGFG